MLVWRAKRLPLQISRCLSVTLRRFIPQSEIISSLLAQSGEVSRNTELSLPWRPQWVTKAEEEEDEEGKESNDRSTAAAEQNEELYLLKKQEEEEEGDKE